MQQPVLQVRDLRAYLFSRSRVTRAVDGVSFTVDAGETLGLVGESGCGKSMTCLAILRLLPKPVGKIVSGEVLLRGEDLLKKPESAMRSYRGKRLALILQDPMTSLNPVLSIGEQVAEPLREHQRIRGKAVWQRVIATLRLLRIPSPETRVRDYPHQMSGGMRQRVGGAIAFACTPDLLMADEPTTALDVTIQAQYLALLKEIQQKTGMAIIFVTHDFGIVAKMCQRVAVMYAGKIVEMAGVRDLFSHTAHPYTEALLNSVPKLEEVLEHLYSIKGQPPLLYNLPPGCSFAPRCPYAGRYGASSCDSDAPPEVQLDPGHMVRCWRHA